MLLRLALAATLMAATLPADATALGDAFEAAVTQNPELRALEARRGILEARLRGANALTPSAPSTTLGYTTDRLTQNRGYMEAEMEVGVPIWMPGQARAQRGLVDAESQRLQALIAAQRLALAGEVRDAYWAWSAADAALTAARARSASAAALARDVRRQARGGQMSEADELLASADAAEAEAGLREAELSLHEARLAFRTLTGRDPRPGWREAPREAPGAPDHPRLVAARLGLDVGRAGLRVAAIEDRESPEIGLFARQERDDRGSGWDTRLGIRVRIPFAHPPRNAERRATAEAEITTAAAEASAIERVVTAERERARAALADTRTTLRLTEARHSALLRAASLSEAAFRQGQSSLAETLRLRASLAAADGDRRRAQVALRRAESRLNQAIGVEP